MLDSQLMTAAKPRRGRPPTGKRQMTAYVDPELHRRLRLKSADTDKTISEIVEEIVREHFGVPAPAKAAPEGQEEDVAPAKPAKPRRPRKQ